MMPVSDARPSRHREVERKFDVADPVAPPSFAGIGEIVPAAEPVTRTLAAVYFDTPAHDLLANRMTLRRRTGGDDAGWHLKLPAGPDTRTEIRTPLDDGDDVPAELRDVVLAIVRDRPLTPIATITTTRDVQLLHDADGALLAEFCDDHVTAAAAGQAGATEQRWREWELEIVEPDATPELLDQLSGRLLSSGATPSRQHSKLARALGSTPSNVVQLDPVRRAVAEQVDRLLVWDRAVRADADDAVHQMRVTIRKIRSLLHGSAAIADELRWLAGLLGVARDAEVLAQRYRQALDRLPPRLVHGPIAERLVDGAARRYQAGRDEALTAMRSARYFRLLDELDTLAADTPASEQPSAPATIAAAYRRVRKATRAARTASHTGRDEALHRIRKSAKRLRYTAAAADATQIAERAKAIQTLLGDHQDSVVSRAHLLREAAAAHAAGEDTFSYGLLYQQEEDLAERCRAQLDYALARLAEVMGGRAGL